MRFLFGVVALEGSWVWEFTLGDVCSCLPALGGRRGAWVSFGKVASGVRILLRGHMRSLELSYSSAEALVALLP